MKVWVFNGFVITDEEQHVTKYRTKYDTHDCDEWRDKNGKVHRPDSGPFAGPARTYIYGELWYHHGVLHRDPKYGAAQDYNFGERIFQIHGRFHNPYGPAITDYKRSEWYLNDKEITDYEQQVTRIVIDEEKGYEKWVDQDGRIHRPRFGPFSGPAMIDENGLSYFEHGVYIHTIKEGEMSFIKKKLIEKNPDLKFLLQNISTIDENLKRQKILEDKIVKQRKKIIKLTTEKLDSSMDMVINTVKNISIDEKCMCEMYVMKHVDSFIISCTEEGSEHHSKNSCHINNKNDVKEQLKNIIDCDIDSPHCGESNNIIDCDID